MCVIVDANVAGEVFGANRSSAGREFRRWITTGTGYLSTGGKQLAELRKLGTFRDWEKNAINYQRIRYEDASKVECCTAKTVAANECQSDDEHVVALANVGSARLLYTNDRALQRDFRNPRLVNDPRGAVFTTVRNPELTDVHRRLMNRTDLCAKGRCNP